MAVIKGIEVTIQVDGRALQEYDDVDEDDQHDTGDVMPHSVSKYVEAKSGARFAIDNVVPKSVSKISKGLSFRIYLDGTYVQKMSMIMNSSNLRRGLWRRDVDGSTKRTKVEEIKRPFIFSEIKCSEDAPPTFQGGQEPIAVETLGTITVKVWRRTKYRRVGNSKNATDFIGHLKDAKELPEKMLKGRNLTHAVSLGEEETSGPLPSIWKSEFVDGEDSPFAIFTFKYCSKKALQSLLLIPRTPSPPPIPIPIPLEDRPVDEMTLEELRELARKQQVRFQSEREANVKPERSIKAENATKSERDIKVERGVKRPRDIEVDALMASASAKKAKGRIANGEIVDLSD